MNLRQAQRSLAELISKCEAAHIQLPKDSLEARSEAVESIIHSLKDGKPDLKAAQEELQQKYGIELVWKQHMENEEAKRQRRRQSRQKKCGGGKTAPSPSQGSMNLGLLPEMPARLEVKAPTVLNLAGGEPLQGTMKNVPIGGVVTLSKRPAASQETPHVGMKIAKKAKSTQGLIVSTAPSDTEEKPPPRSAAALGNILSEDNDDNNESASSGNPDHDIVDLLDLEDLNEVERGGGMSSDEEFAL
ncbi:hypothetical protein PRIC2_012877 [Phytophthora ramorum]|uniref:uncharacterized protein n=1 Tax=Phytophthora ramorum TaxID=164328 RepID=UPI00309C0EF4|nr:hypothetical protein KRP23_8830 [Phytophthora ramorum]